MCKKSGRRRTKCWEILKGGAQDSDGLRGYVPEHVDVRNAIFWCNVAVTKGMLVEGKAAFAKKPRD